MTHRRLLTLVCLLAVAASVTGLRNGYAMDDVAIVLQNDRVHALQPPWVYFAQTYWPPQHGAALYRPLQVLTFALEWVVGGGSPLVFHLASVLLYAAAAGAMYWLAALLLPRGAAFWAAALFAVHPVHVEAVANVVGQSELIVAVLVLAAAGLYVSHRPRGPLPLRATLLLLACCLVALQFKEHAAVLPGLLALVEVLLVEDRTPWRRRAEQALPLFLGMAAILVAFWWLRASVMGGTVGTDVHPAFRDGQLTTRVFTMLALVPTLVRLMLVPGHLSADYNPQSVTIFTTPGPAVAAGFVTIVALGALAVWGWRRRPLMAFGLLWAAVTLLPVSNLLVPTGVLLAERTLFLPSVGIMIALADLVGAGLAARGWEGRRMVPVALSAVVVLGLIRSATRQSVWRDNATLFAQTVRDAPRSYKARGAHAEMLFARGANAEAEREYRLALDLFPYDPYMFSDLGDYYLRNGRYEDALVMYRKALALLPTQWEATSRAIYTLIQVGRLDEARRLAATAAARGDAGAAGKLTYVDSLIAARARP